MPRNLSSPESLANPPGIPTSPIAPGRSPISENGDQQKKSDAKKQIPPKQRTPVEGSPDHNKNEEDPDPLPNPHPNNQAGAHTPLNQNDQEDLHEPGVLEFKTSHLIVACLFLGFLFGAGATLFFLHPGTPLHPLAATPALPNAQDASQTGTLAHTVQEQKDLIQRLKEQARSRIGLPAQTVDAQNPNRVTYTPQDTAIAVQWISNCTSDVTWLCNAPLDPNILSALSQKKGQNCPILVITGKQALHPNFAPALDAGYNVYQSHLSLADNTSILIIDSKLIVDVSNPDFVWASAEPTVVRDIATYAINTLLKNSVHIKN
jgi:hypothetical protein